MSRIPSRLAYLGLYRRDGTVVDVEPAFAQQLGYAPAEIVGSPGWDLQFEPSRDGRRRTVTILRRDHTGFELDYQTRVVNEFVVVLGAPSARSIEATDRLAVELEQHAGTLGVTGPLLGYRDVALVLDRSESTVKRYKSTGLLPFPFGTPRRPLTTFDRLARFLHRHGGGSMLFAFLLAVALLGLLCMWTRRGDCPFLRELGLGVGVVWHARG